MSDTARGFPARAAVLALCAALFISTVTRTLAQCEVGKLFASDASPSDYFGGAVALAGDTALIGAEQADGSEPSSGAAYVFRFDPVNWVEEAKLTASDGEPLENFGWSVAVAAQTAVIGAVTDDDNGPDSGSAYAFRYDGSNWVEEAKLLAFAGASYDSFGGSVAVFGSTALIGAGNVGNTGQGALDGHGAVYVFEFDGADWFQTHELLASDGEPGDYFGGSVAVSDEVAAIGAFRDDDNGGASGSAYVFRYDGSSWAEEAKLLPADGEPGEYFGYAVAISGDTVVVGAYGDGLGSAYVFRFGGSTWVEEAKLLPWPSYWSKAFGAAVAASGGTAVIGACWDNDNGPDAGAAYVFDLDPIPGDLDCDGCVDQSDLGILLADWGCAGGDCSGDCDDDGDTDQADLGILLAHWGEGCG
jgi:hypothetical protein